MKTTKSKVLASLLFTVALITSPSVFADEAQPTTTGTTTPVVDTNAPSNFTLENGSNSGSVTPSVDTTDNSTTEKPKVDTTVGNSTTEKPKVDTTVGNSTTEKPQGKDNAGSLDGVPTDKPVTPDTSSTTDKPQGKDNAGSLDGVPAEKPKTTDEANEQGKSQIGTTSTSTGQTVQDVTEQNPVRTNTGAQIVSTRDGQVILSDGTVTSPEAIGAKTNADKTITVTKEDGSTVTLPHTGDKNTVAFGILGAMTAVAGLTLAFKHKKKA
ncbi:LPXTG cell wall anchor domain-containing protein [Streptococcus vestibularis]